MPFGVSQVVGRVMAETILGKEPSLPMEPFSFDRFKEPQSQDKLVI